nr:TniQ family protein [Solirubrobacterales bacterium]
MNAAIVDGRIPIRLAPIEGESLDGWLDAYAQRLRVSTIQLGDALAIPAQLLRRTPAKIALAADALDAERIAAGSCGIDPAQVHGLWQGLVRYDRLVAERVGETALWRALRPMSWSRYCPSCLRETHGRWLTAWRLPWYLACPEHERMLACRCEVCDGTQRNQRPRARHVTALTTACSHPVDAIKGSGDNRCRHDLTTTPAQDPAPSELLAAQADLRSILDATLSDPEAEALIDRLVDLITVATHAGLDLGAIDGFRHNATKLLTAPISDAQRVLTDPHGPRLRALANDDQRSAPQPLPGSWRTVSPSLAAIVLAHRDARLRPTDRLRYRTVTATARPPEGVNPKARLGTIPLALWPDWAIRLRPAAIESNNFRVCAAAALCVPGASATLQEISEHWPQERIMVSVSRLGQIIAIDPCATAILHALCELTDELDRDGAPIDYERRRTVATELALLDAGTWAAMCRAGGTPTGSHFKLRAARLWLWETLTGGIAEQAPVALRPRTASEYQRYQRFALKLPGATIRRLLAHARILLDEHGFRDEPVTWSPAGEQITVEALPGPDPDALDADDALALLAKDITPGDAAAQLGVRLDHLRYTIRTPAPEEDVLAVDLPPRARLAALITADQLRQQIADGATLRALAAHHGVQRDTIRNELAAHNIPIPSPGGRARYHLDPEWLYEQYVTKQRTMPEIAAETGAAPATIARLIHEYAIPARGRGAPSHQQSLTAGDGYPEPLASAVLRPGGTERV